MNKQCEREGGCTLTTTLPDLNQAMFQACLVACVPGVKFRPDPSLERLGLRPRRYTGFVRTVSVYNSQNMDHKFFVNALGNVLGL